MNSRMTGASTARRRLTRVVALTAAAMVAIVAATAAPATAQQGPGAATVTRGQHRYRATQPIVMDAQTRQRRLPTTEELGQLVDSLASLTSRPTEGLAETTLDNRAVVLDLAGGFNGVMLARVNEDGTLETRCVFTFEEGAEFLGLVIDVQ